LLKIQNLYVHYGPVPVLYDVSMEVNKGEMVALVGANNAGKTTLLKTITGLIRPTSGSISFDGIELTKLPPHEIVNQGVVLVPEGRQIFPQLTVEENLLLGSYNPRAKREREIGFEQVYSLFPVLKERRTQKAGTLSGGEQQMLALGRGLMARPKILLLDEPSLGLGPALVRELFQVLERLNKEGLTIFMSEQNVRVSLSMSHRGYVLLHGRVYLSGESQKLARDERLKKAYLGLAE
jgi:branched-chain amino acid transport system ATP-binding protein